ncbi:outer membrane beta-barrel protein [Candidatus Palauibacter sp.]|uniref:outer membrane beta-barrel protein n=1 Tax=Candidatus Palauibacter sp. TaxID=3101350 RepID=UPI003B590433
MRLPRRLLVALVIVICTSPVPILVAQTTVGLRGGLTRATLSFGDMPIPVVQESRSRIRFGVSATAPVSGGLGIRFSGDYVQAGGGFALPGLSEFVSGEDQAGVPPDARIDGGLDLDYFRFSALARAGLPMESRRVAVYLLAGPFVGFRSGCTMSAGVAGVSFSADCDEADVDLPTTDFGISGGVGLEVGVSDGMAVGLEALYDLGLKDLEDAKTRVFSILAGLVFSL